MLPRMTSCSANKAGLINELTGARGGFGRAWRECSRALNEIGLLSSAWPENRKDAADTAPGETSVCVTQHRPPKIPAILAGQRAPHSKLRVRLRNHSRGRPGCPSTAP